MIRSALLYHVYSGHIFFTAIALFVIGVLLGKRGRIMAAVAIPLALLSGTPMPLFFAIPLAVLALATLWARGDLGGWIIRGAAIVAALSAAALEYPYHRALQQVPVAPRMMVVGDSLSSGGFGETVVWPQLMGIRGVANVSRPSDTTKTALDSMTNLPPPASRDVVMIAIGGNDMVEKLSVEDFERALDAIVRSSRPRTPIMLELPVLPGRWAYAAAQRRVAKRQKIVLVPKRVLALVLAGEGNTSDGLHLTSQGHTMLAAALKRELGWETVNC
ncbi:MAG TPA: SGNH/GDSL hydrolase family protein [Thermoanaerobaculia bacterium]